MIKRISGIALQKSVEFKKSLKFSTSKIIEAIRSPSIKNTCSIFHKFSSSNIKMETPKNTNKMEVSFQLEESKKFLEIDSSKRNLEENQVEY